MILELDGNSRAVKRQGRVIGGKGTDVEVRWDDLALETLRLGIRGGSIFLTVPADSLRHHMFTAPGEVRATLTSHPEQVFLLALREYERPVKAKELVDRVRQEFGGEDVAELWKQAKQRFESHPEVQASGSGAKRSYRCVGPGLNQPEIGRRASVPPSEPPKEPETDASSDDEAASNKGLVSREEAQQEPNVSDDSAEPSVAAVDLKRVLRDLAKGRADKHSEDEVSAAVGRAHPALRLVYAALTSESEVGKDRIDEVLKCRNEPLATGIAAGELTDDTLAVALPRLGRLAWVLLGIPRKCRPADTVDGVGIVGRGETEALLSRARREASAPNRTPENESLLDRAYGHLAGRVLATPTADRLSPRAILDATRPLAYPSEAARSDALANLLAAAFTHGGLDAWADLSTADRGTIARRVSAAPLAQDSGRLRLLTWLWRNDSQTLEDPVWWKDVGVAELSNAALTPLAAALEQEVIRKSVVEPIMKDALETAATRRQLMAVLGSPGPVVEVLEASAVARALERSWREEDVARPWLAEVSNEAEIGALREQVGRLQEALEASRMSLKAAQETAESARERMLQVERRLQQAAESKNLLRESQSRQIRVDAFRALADLAAYIDGALERQSPERIRHRLSVKLEREGLSRIGEIGATAAYDPRIHDLVGPGQPPGSSVTVSAVGYLLKAEDEDTVLTRAIVEPTNEEI